MVLWVKEYNFNAISAEVVGHCSHDTVPSPPTTGKGCCEIRHRSRKNRFTLLIRGRFG
jgi:hypothetical protein